MHAAGRPARAWHGSYRWPAADHGNVRDAVAGAGSYYPGRLDPAYARWDAYRNSYWPAFFAIDRSGQIRHSHIGEGD